MNLYKYLIPDRIDVLKNKSIRFSQHMALNDPFEMKPFFELLAEDAIMKQLFCFGGEDTWNAGFDMGYSTFRMVFDEMKKHFPDEASTREMRSARANSRAGRLYLFDPGKLVIQSI